MAMKEEKIKTMAAREEEFKVAEKKYKEAGREYKQEETRIRAEETITKAETEAGYEKAVEKYEEAGKEYLKSEADYKRAKEKCEKVNSCRKQKTAVAVKKFTKTLKELTNFCLPSVKRRISVVSSFDEPRKKLRHIFTNRMKYKDNLLFVTPHKTEAVWYKTAITLCSWYFRVNGEEICVFYFGKEGKQFAEWFKNYGDISTESDSY